MLLADMRMQLTILRIRWWNAARCWNAVLYLMRRTSGGAERVMRTLVRTRSLSAAARGIVAGYPLGGTLTGCDPFDIPSTSPWTGAAIIVQYSRTKSCIVVQSRPRPGRCSPLRPGDLK
jgi:hypothetical protein